MPPVEGCIQNTLTCDSYFLGCTLQNHGGPNLAPMCREGLTWCQSQTSRFNVVCFGGNWTHYRFIISFLFCFSLLEWGCPSFACPTTILWKYITYLISQLEKNVPQNESYLSFTHIWFWLYLDENLDLTLLREYCNELRRLGLLGWNETFCTWEIRDL